MPFWTRASATTETHSDRELARAAGKGSRKEWPLGSVRALVRGLWEFWFRYRRNTAAVLGLGVVFIFTLIALVAAWIAPHEPTALIARPFIPPGWLHLLGTDNLGRDVLSGVVYGARVSLAVGFLAAVTSTIIGVIVGAISGYQGGTADAIFMRLTELFQVLPRFFLALLIVALAGPGLGKIIFVIAILSWPPMARLVRAEFLSLREREYVEAARALGAPTVSIVFKQILPNALPPVIVTGSLDTAQAILLEAGLSFFGLGDPNLTSWGTLLNNALAFLRTAWWMPVFPGLAIFLTVLGFNLLGDGLNDALNPRLRSR